MNNADKASTSSDRSCRTHSEDADTSSLSSIHKRSIFANRLPFLSTAQHRNQSLESGTSMTNNIPEVDDQHLADENLSIIIIGTSSNDIKDCDLHEYQVKPMVITKSSLDVTTTSTGSSDTINLNNKSKIAALRQNFFSQNDQTNTTSNMPINKLTSSSSSTSIASKEQK